MRGAGKRGRRGNCGPDVISERKINTKEKRKKLNISNHIKDTQYVLCLQHPCFSSTFPREA